MYFSVSATGKYKNYLSLNNDINYMNKSIRKHERNFEI